MAPSSIIVLDDSDSEDIQLITDDAADATFCQICQVSLRNKSLEAKQAHYDQHFGGEDLEEEVPIIEGMI